jgi:hypothetical protein
MKRILMIAILFLATVSLMGCAAKKKVVVRVIPPKNIKIVVKAPNLYRLADHLGWLTSEKIHEPASPEGPGAIEIPSVLETVEKEVLPFHITSINQSSFSIAMKNGVSLVCGIPNDSIPDLDEKELSYPVRYNRVLFRNDRDVENFFRDECLNKRFHWGKLSGVEAESKGFYDRMLCKTEFSYTKSESKGVVTYTVIRPVQGYASFVRDFNFKESYDFALESGNKSVTIAPKTEAFSKALTACDKAAEKIYSAAANAAAKVEDKKAKEEKNAAAKERHQKNSMMASFLASKI